MTPRTPLALLLPLSSAGCLLGGAKETPLSYKVSPDSVDFGEARYDQDDLPATTVSVLNEDTRTLLVTPGEIDDAPFLVVDGDAFAPIAPGDSVDIDLSVSDELLNWDEGSYTLELPITIETQVTDDGAEPVQDIITLSINLTLLCDLDGDGAEALATSGTDCDDTVATINAAATEVCDGLDNDCDGLADEDDASDALIWYRDGDEDGYGVDSDATTACEKPSGYVGNGADCDDGNDQIYPGATETCNDADDDCDGTVDEDDASDAGTWYLDEDSDSYGVETTTTTACDRPDGYAEVADDCDDGDAAVNPGAIEVCDSVDNDCDSKVDESLTCE